MHYDILFAHFSRASRAKYIQLRARFGTIADAWQASAEHLATHTALPADWIADFCAFRSSRDSQKIHDTLAEQAITVLFEAQAEYPALLKEIPDPPWCLFVRGTLRQKTHMLGVVGSRACSSYGKDATQTIVSKLAQAGVGIVSGLALGIDGIAHQATVPAGYTVAVLGCAIDTIYPAAHRELAQDILGHGGAIISEYAPGTTTYAHDFAKRNRIIAGLSHGVLVTEAAEESGSLITAKLALDYNRDVYAIPHPITNPKGVGANTLIQQGAVLVRSADDVLDYFPDVIKTSAPQTYVPQSKEETRILALLEAPQYIDTLIEKTMLPPQIISDILLTLEMHNAIIALGGMRYQKR